MDIDWTAPAGIDIDMIVIYDASKPMDDPDEWDCDLCDQGRGTSMFPDLDLDNPTVRIALHTGPVPSG